MLPDQQLFLNVPFQSTKYRKKEFCVDNKVRETIADVYCPTCRNEKCVYLSTNKITSVYDCKKCKASCNVLNIPFKDQNRQLCCLVVTVHIVLRKRVVATTENENHLLFWGNFSANHNQAHPNVNQKGLKRVQIWKKRIRFLLADDLSDIFIFQIIFFNFNLQSTAQT